MFNIIIDVLSKPLLIVILLSILSGIATFGWLFFWRWRSLEKEFNGIITELKTVPSHGSTTDISIVRSIFARNPSLSHIWKEYEETLHFQYAETDGERNVVAIRQTIPAEIYFNTNVLVNTPLKMEFFKHLPGILTGLGIVGTFAGLLFALDGFNADPSEVKNSIERLLAGVKDAFIVSGFAIFSAILITGFEKLCSTKSYEKVERLYQLVDALFLGGAGEEYLERIVNSGEETANSTNHLREAMVNDMKIMLTNLIENQTQGIASALSSSLKTPLEELNRGIQTISTGATDGLSTALQDTMARMVDKIESTFGQNITGMNDVMLKSVGAIAEMRDGLNNMVQRITQAGSSGAEAMSEKMQAFMLQAEQRQANLDAQMQSFISGLQAQMAKLHEDSGSQQRDVMQGISAQMNEMMKDMRDQREQARAWESEQLGEQQKRAATLVEGMSAGVDALHEKLGTSIVTMSENVTQLGRIVTDAIDRMNLAASNVLQAANVYAGSSDALSNIVSGTGQLQQRMLDSSATLNGASTQLAEVVKGYQSTKTILELVASNAQNILREVEEKSSNQSKIVDEIRVMADRLTEVKQQTTEYLGAVNGVLTSAFGTFSDGVSQRLNDTSTQFHANMENSVNALAAGFQNLQSNLEDITEALAKLPDFLGRKAA